MYGKFIRRTLTAAVSVLLCWALTVGVLDPFFHYHAPWFGLEPVVDNERYQNPGMAEHFPYDSMILGSSMTENFRTGWFDEAFGCSSIKLPFSAARTGAYDHMLKKGFATRELKNVFIGLDSDSLIEPYGTYMFPLPEYLYDSDPLNDVEYLLNFSMLEPLWNLIAQNASGTAAPLEDAYVWDAPGIYGREKVISKIDWEIGKRAWQKDCSQYVDNCRENLEKNLLPHIKAHPETEFYIFFPPYSVLWWSRMENTGEVDARLAVTREALYLLLPCENVRLYSLLDFEDVVCDLDNYKDYNHYSAEISKKIVSWLQEGQGLVTWENRNQVLERLERLAKEFDFQALLEAP